ncbi:hypothetical protein V6Z11_A12G307600 [Gossypium hirsutum]
MNIFVSHHIAFKESLSMFKIKASNFFPAYHY